jgi:nitroreductase/FMN reductase [NAD(P)H]
VDAAAGLALAPRRPTADNGPAPDEEIRAMTQKLSDLLTERFGAAPAVPAELEADPVLCNMAAHRSYRRFEERAVPEALLDTLLACAFSAPAKSDLQQSCVVKVSEPALRGAIDALLADPWIARAPVLLVWCGDNRRIRRVCELRGKPFANDHLDSFFNAAVDAALVMRGFIQASEAAGLGCCPLSVVRNHAARVSDLLGLPAHVFPVAGMVLGWPAEQRRIVPRLSLGAFVHENRYDDSDLCARLERDDARRHAVLPIARDKQRDTARFGVAAQYGWSEDKARQVSVRERGDFGAFVRAQGFRLE